MTASTKGGINNGTIVKSTTISDVIKETDEPFMSAESFDFNQTIQSPYIGSPSMAGPLTRYSFSTLVFQINGAIPDFKKCITPC